MAKNSRPEIKPVNFDLFNRVVNRDLRPHLKAFDTKEKIEILYKNAQVIRKGKIMKGYDPFQGLNLREIGLKDGDEFSVEFITREDGVVQASITNLSEEELDDLIDIGIPPPPDLKAEYFQFILEREYRLLIIRIDYFFEKTAAEADLKFFASKNIQLLKKLASEAHLYEKKLAKDGVDNYDNPNTYAIDVLKTYVLRLILKIQNLFEPFLSIPYQSEEELQIELYEYWRTLEMFRKFEEESKKRMESKKALENNLSQKSTPDTLATLLTEEKQIFIFEMLEALSITLDGKSTLSIKKKSAIRGVVEALKENHILPERGIDFLCKIIGTAIGLDISSKLESSYTSETFRKSANKYIAQNYNK